MKYLLVLVILSAAAAFGQNAYGPDFLNLHCTAPDANSNTVFGIAPKPGLAPNTSANGNVIVYCDASSGALKASFNGAAYTNLFAPTGIVNANGLKCDGVTDDTAALNALLTSVMSSGGGTILFPMGKTCLFNSARITIPINADSWPDGAGTISSQNHLRLSCAGSAPDFQLMSSGSLPGQANATTCQLDLEFNDPVAKIFSRGSGRLEIDHLAFVDKHANDCTPNSPAFLMVTNTTLNFHDNAVVGSRETLPTPATATLSLISGASAGTQQFIKLTYVNGAIEESYANGPANQTPAANQQVQVTSPVSFGQATGYNIYGSSTIGGTYFLQNTGGVISLGTNFTVPGTLISTGTTAPANNSAYSCNDGIILGGTDTTPSLLITAPFQGYGTVIQNNFFNALKRATFAQTFANDIKILWNKSWSQSGCASCGVFEFNSGPTAVAAGSDTVVGNVMEVVHYPFGVNLVSQGIPSTAWQNNCYDGAEFSTVCLNASGGSVAQFQSYGGYQGQGQNIAASDVLNTFVGTDASWSRANKVAMRTNDYYILDKGGHVATSTPIGDTITDTAPKCTMVAGTCSFTFTTTWNVAPRCVGVYDGTGTFTTGAKLTVSSTTSTVTATSSTGTDTAEIQMICLGAPR